MPNASMYFPILVGAKKNWNKDIEYQRDDVGPNISEKNPNFNELTAIYWAWKNVTNVDALGLVHYRRFFFGSSGKTLRDVLTQKDAERYLKDFDVLLPRKRKYYIESNYSHYIHAHHKEPLDETRRIIEQVFPEYVASFDKVMSKRSAHMFNMFIMKKELFDNYAEWLFSILNRLESKVDISKYDTQEARVFGYISELLMDVWIDTNQIKYKELRWNLMGKSHLLKKASYFLLRKFGIGKKQTHF